MVSPGLLFVETSLGDAQTPEQRLAQAAATEFKFIWRTLRRLGVAPPAAVDDAVQRVFEIAVRKAARVEPGRERAYLFKTALLVAAEARRGQRRTREVELTEAVAAVDPAPMPDEQLEASRARACLDQLLDTMETDLRAVFVLFELEGLSTLEISLMLDVPVGTAASRLRRAREQFHAASRRLRARMDFSGGEGR